MPMTSHPLDSANDSPPTPLRFLQHSAEVFPAKTAIVYGARNYTCAQFAVPLAGCILVALNPGLAPAEVRCPLDHSEASLLFYDAEFASDVGDSLEQCAALRAIVEIPDAEFGCSESGVAIGQDSYLSFGSTTATDESPVRWEIDDERAVISINYTSGTTGKVVKASVRALSLQSSRISTV